ncbi:MAG: methylmalonyl Co-A mutase-associated GTPase MeaB [Trueperaceae bacterium]
MTGHGAGADADAGRPDVDRIAAAVRRGERRGLARAISWFEAGDARGPAVLARLRAEAPASRRPAHWIGVTGAPGSGKSTLVDRLVQHERAHGRTVAVVAVDPSSPFSGGAILGDRVRMTRWHDDPGVFVRSMATRGRLGGLAGSTLRVAALLDAAGFDAIVLETVGVGQSEVDVVDVADTTVLVLTPGGGDGVQAFKAGVMEIADLFVVNKADLPGADRLRSEIRDAQRLAAQPEGAWCPPVLLAKADRDEGTTDVAEALARHHERWGRGHDRARQERRARAELRAAVRTRAEQAFAEAGDRFVPDLVEGRITAEAAAERLCADVVRFEP